MNLGTGAQVVTMILTVFIMIRKEFQAFSMSLSVEAGFTLLIFVFTLSVCVTIPKVYVNVTTTCWYWLTLTLFWIMAQYLIECLGSVSLMLE